MNKVICDVCGTTFPETATRCPICGCAKQPNAQTVVVDESQPPKERSATNTYSKGGRFAKTNVKNAQQAKRNPRPAASAGRFSSDRKQNTQNESGSKGLIAVVIILLLAIVMVVVYIGVKVFFPELQSDANQSGNNAAVTPGGDNGGESIPCTSIKVWETLELNTVGEVHALHIQKEPANTTDVVKFKSSNSQIVTVDDKGNVSPVSYGDAIITVTCGNASATCTVLSRIGTPPATTTPTTPAVTLPEGFKLKLKTWQDKGEITLSEDYPTAILYTETKGIKASDITWEISDPAIAKVENGKAIAVGKGNCVITATIGNQTATCKVIVSFDPPEPAPYKLNKTDVTISKGETFTLSLSDPETGANIQGLEWHASSEGIVSINGNKVTGGTVSQKTLVEVYTEYDDVKYICKVYVKAPEA